MLESARSSRRHVRRGIVGVGGDSVDEDADSDECDEFAGLPAGCPCARCFVACEAEFSDEASEDRTEPTRSEPTDFGSGESPGIQDL